MRWFDLQHPGLINIKAACDILTMRCNDRSKAYRRSSLSLLSSHDRYRLFTLASVGACMAGSAMSLTRREKDLGSAHRKLSTYRK